ncbi:hypothetical protein BY458DRAFT_513682 [Sporodiniella umbellata]|nr:hypothetical protein BY458DRAFT_513682 [Sporodiniella umbellata]
MMGCCQSIPQENPTPVQRTTTPDQDDPQTSTKTASVQSIIADEKQPQKRKTLSGDYPFLVRLSSNGQDVPFQLPTEPPFLTVATLRERLMPHLQGDVQNVKLIYLGRILSDQYQIAPSAISLPKNKSTVIQIQKDCVIQAMVSSQQ